MQTTQPDQATNIAWTVIKVFIALVRYCIGAVLTLAAIGQLLMLSAGGSLWHAFLLAVFAVIIWPEIYGPPTRIIRAFQKRPALTTMTNKTPVPTPD